MNTFPTTIVAKQLSLEQNIKDTFKVIRSTKQLIKEKRQMLKDAFEGDAQYKKINDELSAQKTQLKSRKMKMIEETPSLATLQEQIDVLKEDKKSYQLTLSDFLGDYVEKTGNTTVPNDVNEIVKIEVKKVCKVKKI